MRAPREETSPNEKKLHLASFAIHATRGLLRDRQMRRKTMLVLTLAALVLLFSGATFLTSVLDPQTRPGWFIFYWLVCAWITFTVVMLAVFDLLLVRAEERRECRQLAEKLAASPPNDHA
ncbi:MAG TPA: hypothetical protein VHW03_05760 [Chthoniobacterales bacterium]|nr:hypothetical protein [Chthoniobacterales bacterium]